MDQIVRSQDLAAKREPRVVTVLGATGSIGRSTADILCDGREAFTVAAIAGGRDPLALAKTAVRLGAGFAALADPSGYAALKDALFGTGIKAALRVLKSGGGRSGT